MAYLTDVMTILCQLDVTEPPLQNKITLTNCAMFMKTEIVGASGIHIKPVLMVEHR